jgi:hypothetical protein
MATRVPTETLPPDFYSPANQAAMHRYDHFRLGHVILYAIAFVIFAFAALALRLFTFKNVVRVHYWLQIFATALMFGGYACGVWLAQNDGPVHVRTYHSRLTGPDIFDADASRTGTTRTRSSEP